MKITISGKVFVKKYKTGVQRYAIEIIKALDEKIKKDEIELVVPKYCENLKFNNIKVVRFGKLKENLWEQIELPIYAKKNRKVLVSLSNTSPILMPGIVCIHDINCIKNKKYYPKMFSMWYSILFKNAVRRGKKIITVSNFSKKEIENWYNIKNVEVVPDSYEHIYKIKEDNNILEKLKLEKSNYFFTLGTIQKNKNIEWVLNVAKNNPNEIFVITGYKNQKNIEFELENVIYTGYLKDEQIKGLMKNAKGYLMPSFYEGFGLPPLEAFSLETPVIVSDIPVMHEIFENEVTYINPNKYDVDLKNIKASKNKQKILNKYSWEKSAEKLLKIIRKIENE